MQYYQLGLNDEKKIRREVAIELKRIIKIKAEKIFENLKERKIKIKKENESTGSESEIRSCKGFKNTFI